jgi:hypothetical protein
MPKHTGDLSPDVLNAALHGLEAQKQTIDRHIQQVRSMLGLGTGRRGRPPKSAASPLTPPTRKGRRRSPEARARMAEAQRKRWAVIKGVKEAPAKGVTKKRKLSAAGRERIIEATKKRWDEYRAKKEAS